MTTKCCTKCGEELPATLKYFHKHNTGKYGLNPRCKSCRKADSHERFLANRETIMANNAKWKRANPDKIAAQVRRWAKEHPERTAEKARRYRENHPERYRAMLHKRRAAMASGAGISGEDVKGRYAAQGGLCQWCSVDLNGDYHIDHFIPLSRGGEHGPSNLVLACATCNLTKFNRLPFTEWVPPNPLSLF